MGNPRDVDGKEGTVGGIACVVEGPREFLLASVGAEVGRLSDLGGSPTPLSLERLFPFSSVVPLAELARSVVGAIADSLFGVFSESDNSDLTVFVSEESLFLLLESGESDFSEAGRIVFPLLGGSGNPIELQVWANIANGDFPLSIEDGSGLR